MEYDACLLDELDTILEDRRDLSQYSFDPDDRLETVVLPDSQQSSQASDKADVFLGVSDDDKPSGDLDVETMYLCPTSVTEWLARTDNANPLPSSQEVPLAFELEDNVEVI